jgi:hypothetical protein
VVPVGTVVELVGALVDSAGVHVKTILSATATPRLRFRAASAPSDSLHWTPAGGIGCISRRQNATAWYDPCQDFFRLDNDSDPTRDIFGAEMRGTGKSKSMWRLDELEVQQQRKNNTPPQNFVRWDPGADTKSNCQPVTVGVTVEGVGLSTTTERCEVWDIDKGANAPDFANRWRGHVWRSERSTASVVATAVAEGSAPEQYVSFDYDAR